MPDWSPLMLAAAEGHREAADVLLRYRADLEAKDHAGDIAVAHAIARGFSEIVEMLDAI